MAVVKPQDLVTGIYTDLKAGNLKKAYNNILFLLDLDPDHVYGLYFLGTYYSKNELHQLAILAYEKCVQLAPDFSEAINNLGGAYRKLNYQQKALDCFQKAIDFSYSDKFKRNNGEQATKLQADYYSNLGSALVGNHASEEALKALDKALEIYPDCQNAHWNRSLALLELGQYEEGFSEYEYGDRIEAKRARNYKTDAEETPYWNGEKDKTVVVYGEQGIGDEIMFATIIPDLAKESKHVIYDAHPRLYKMFRRSFLHLKNVDVYGTRKHVEIAWAKRHNVDYKLAIGSLAKHYRKKRDDFPGTPYLSADPGLVKYVKDIRMRNLPDGPKIGLSWKGGTRGSSKHLRILPMEDLIPLLEEFPDASFFSLQYHSNAQYEVDTFNEATGFHIRHFPKEIADYELTAALVENLDYIISVPQSVVHLAGAMGKRVIQLCPYRHIWQMGAYGEDMPWYRSVSNVWQSTDGNWNSTIDGAIKLIKEEESGRCKTTT